MAEAQPVTDDPIAGLIDIPLPHEVSLWPQTWEARVATILVLASLIVLVWRVAHVWRVNRYRRAALAELEVIKRANSPAASDLTDRLALLVRRTALAAFARERVAPLSGPAWLTFLDHSYGGHEFSEGVGRLLVTRPYQVGPPNDANLTSLVALVRRWIKVHHA